MILLLAFVFFLLLQLYFYLFVFGRYALSQQEHPSGKQNPPGVSVVISAFNEGGKLLANLRSIAGQIYPDFEIILVDDGSSDQTAAVLEAFRNEYHRDERPISFLCIPAERSTGKKHALSKGIEKASKEIILLTDADCRPISPYWIQQMAARFQGNCELVLGYGPYKRIPGSFLNKLIRYETLLTAVQYFSYAVRGTPYMGVGRNMAYLKTLFEQASGFEKHSHIKSGDDDLFVNQMATKTNTAICDHPDSFTVSEPKRSYSTWIRQKRRHITTASHYKKSQKIRLAAFYVSQVAFYILGSVLLLSGVFSTLVLLLVMARFTAFYWILYRSAKKLGEKDLLSLAPLYEISVIFMQLHVFIFNKVSPPKHW